jgi:hypothetical protein
MGRRPAYACVSLAVVSSCICSRCFCSSNSAVSFSIMPVDSAACRNGPRLVGILEEEGNPFSPTLRLAWPACLGLQRPQLAVQPQVLLGCGIIGALNLHREHGEPPSQPCVQPESGRKEALGGAMGGIAVMRARRTS